MGPGNLTAYTAPSDASVIVKFAGVWNTSAAPLDCTFFMFTREGTLGVPIIKQTIAANAAVFFSGWAVINHEDRLLLSLTTGQVNFWVSGAVLPVAPGQVSPALETFEAFDGVLPPVSDVVYLPEGEVALTR